MAVTKKIELFLREQRGEEIKRHPVTDVVRSTSVDVLDPHEREVLVTLLRRTDLTGDGVTGFEGIILYLTLADIDVVRGVEIIVVRRTEKTITVRHDLQNTRRLHSTVKLDFRSFRPLIWILEILLGLLLLVRVLSVVLPLELVLLLSAGNISMSRRIILQIIKKRMNELLAIYRLVG